MLTHLTVLTEQVAGGIVVPGSGRLVACLDVDDLVIVDMPDTLLVTTRARSQEVKRLLKKARTPAGVGCYSVCSLPHCLSTIPPQNVFRVLWDWFGF